MVQYKRQRQCFCYIIISLLINGCILTSQDIPSELNEINGTWKDDNSPWQITIENGRVLSAVHPFGTAPVIPNETTYIEMLDGSKSSYKSGDFPLQYDTRNREIEIVIKIEKIHIRFMDTEIIGNTETIIGGVVSDNFEEFRADVIEFFDYGPRFPMDPNNVEMRPTVFRKTQLNKRNKVD